MNPDQLIAEVNNTHFEYNEETRVGNYVVNIRTDDDPESPREWDNLGTMVCFHRRYNLGDNHSYTDPREFIHHISGLYEDESYEYLTDEQYERCETVAYEKNVILPLYLYDHSGITMNTSGFSCPWDSGQVGWIYIPLTKIREEFSVKRVTKKMRERIAQYLTNEVETYDNYITGNVYGFSIERHDEDGDDVDIDSCWGFFGHYTDDDGYMLKEIKAAIIYDINNTPAQLDLV
jgi:hypothetical protein